MGDPMSTPRKTTSMQRTRITIVIIIALLMAGIVVPSLLADRKHSELTVLPAAARTFTPSPPGYDCKRVERGSLCTYLGYHLDGGPRR